MNPQAHRIRDELPGVFLFIGSIWVVFFADLLLPIESFGLVPRRLFGLAGIVTMPFLHASLAHLLSNTAPLLVLLSLLAGSKADSRIIVAAIIVQNGALLWLMGRGGTSHIGASGLVFGLAVFLIVSGFLERRFVPLAISIVVMLMYGSSLISGIIPWQPGISWDGHLFGGIAGASTAWWLIKRR